MARETPQILAQFSSDQGILLEDGTELLMESGTTVGLEPGGAMMLYQCEGQQRAEVYSLIACNRGASAATFRIAVTRTLSIDDEDYLQYDYPIEGNRTYNLTVGLTLRAGEMLQTRSVSEDLSFNALGNVISGVRA